ncbi:MAG: DUF559 domain-containing protein, partial [Candidatus Dormibacteraeota bacterium]|nr:DUF559 domain-containing protein [Candidatus Dormibacteraeota bacterium]
MARPANVPDELTRGPFTVAQALAAGLTRRQLEGASWQRLSRGWYAFAGLGGTAALEPAALARVFPAGSVLAGTTAFRLYGLTALAESRPEVILPSAAHAATSAGLVVRKVRLEPGDVTCRRGVRVTTPLRTCFDLASRLPMVDAVVAIDEALHRRLVSLDGLRQYVARCAGVRGVRQARSVVDLAEPASESPMETRLRCLLVMAGLPRPAAQVSLRDHAGAFIGRPDLYYPEARLAVEYDGNTHRETLIADNRRQNRLQQAGIKLLRYTAPDVYERSEVIVAEVRTFLGSARSARSSPASSGRLHSSQ